MISRQLFTRQKDGSPAAGLKQLSHTTGESPRLKSQFETKTEVRSKLRTYDAKARRRQGISDMGSLFGMRKSGV